MVAYYNEFDPYAAQWLRNLIAAGHIAPGDVDERSSTDVKPDDLNGYTQCHFFAGIGGWSLAARMAGWPDNRELWTGSAPCQPFSVAGKQAGQNDERHLWPAFAALIAAQRPAVVMGEQVAAAVGKNWLDGVQSDMEGFGYICGAAVVPACAVDAPHRRDRLWFVADARGRRCTGSGEGQDQQSGRTETVGSGEGALANTNSVSSRQVDQDTGWCAQGSGQLGRVGGNSRSSAWVGAEWLIGADGKTRRFKPSIHLLAHGVPARVGKLRAYGNAIVPQVAAEIIGAYLDADADRSVRVAAS